jgi:hypothetical protein
VTLEKGEEGKRRREKGKTGWSFLLHEQIPG